MTSIETVTAGVPAFSLRGVEQLRGSTRTLRGVDLDVPAGEVVALVGPSGAGKTSLIRLLDRLDDPSSGTVTYQGAPIASIPVRELRRRVGFVFQTPVMFAGSVADNLSIARDLPYAAARLPAVGRRPAVPPAARERTLAPDDALRLAGVDPALASRDAQTLSGGERQRVSIARALMTSPDALLLDEPTSALDPDVADHVMATIRTLADTMHLTVVMVSHRLAEARAVSTHTVFMEAGRVIETGPTEMMFTAPHEARTREYLLRGDVK
ncbi:MAG: ABC-type polar amino acid transport system, ATPase component [Gemmatimonadetes bacterium]|nr:ABC-type polar amino acid transport system, ATPase component [Gemmatimonadota bacterium]